MIGIGWGIDHFFENYTENNTDSDIVSNYKALGKQLAKSIASTSNASDFIAQWNKLNRNKISLIEYANFPLPVELESGFLSGEGLILESDNKLSLHYYLERSQQVFSFMPDELSQDTSPSLISVILTIFFYGGVFSLILLWSYPLVVRLRLLRRTAMAFGSGDLAQRIGLNKSSYIRDIEIEFNRMAQRIESLVKDNKLISSAVSHDLRTPLARLRLGVDVLTESDNQANRTKYQQRLSRDIDEMQSLVEVLLDYAKLDQSLIKQEQKPVDLKRLIHRCQSFYSERAKILQIIAPENGIEIMGDSRYLDILFKNLVGNAIKYCEYKVIIELESSSKDCKVKIHDDGRGVSPVHKSNIFKPFIKHDSDGYGMGLAIAERIAHWHQGEISVSKSTLIGGAVFKVEFPLVK